MDRETTEGIQNYNAIDEDRLFFISDVNKYIDIADELPIKHEDLLKDSIDAFKESLKSTINKLYEEIDFLKSEIEEKNLMIRALIFRDANDGEKIDRGIVEESQINIQVVETIPNASENI